MIRAHARFLLGRATGYAIAAAVLSLAIAAVLSGADAERFATTAYLAAIFGALAIAARRFLPDVEPPPRSGDPELPFPAVFKFVVGIVALVGFGASFVFDPVYEGIALAACFGLVGVAALVRAGTVRRTAALLAGGGAVAATRRYAVVVCAVALATAALLAPQDSERYAKIGYALAVIGVVTVAASLLYSAHPRMRAAVTRVTAMLATPASGSVYSACATYAGAAAVLAMLFALVLSGEQSERFATVGYVAAVFGAVALAAKWRIGAPAGAAIALRTPGDVLRFAEGVAALTIAGAALAGSPFAQVSGILGCLWIVAYAVAIRNGAAKPLRVPKIALQYLTGEPLTDIVRLAVAVAMFALALTAVLPGEYADRSLSVAYYAAVAVAIVLIVRQVWRSRAA